MPTAVYQKKCNKKMHLSDEAALSALQTIIAKSETIAQNRAREISSARKMCKNSRKIAIFFKLGINFACSTRTRSEQGGKCLRTLRAPQTLTGKGEIIAQSRAREISPARKMCKNSRKSAIFFKLDDNFARAWRTRSEQAGKCWCTLSTPQTLNSKSEMIA